MSDSGFKAPGPSAQDVAQAAVALVSDLKGARIFVYVDAGGDSEATVFASGDDEDAGDLMLAVSEWLDAADEDADDD